MYVGQMCVTAVHHLSVNDRDIMAHYDLANALANNVSHNSSFSFSTISRSSQCSTTGVTKAVVCVILSVGWCV